MPSRRTVLTSLDAHTAGEPLRLITSGFPTIEGETMLERRAWLREHHDELRTALMLEPRGHADMYGAVLTPPERPDSDAGVLFMHNEGYSTMCGHGVIAVVTLALEHGLIVPRQAPAVVLDAPAGQIHATAHLAAGDGDAVRVSSVSFRNVPSFVLAAGLRVPLGSRTVLVDVAFGGAFYAVVDAEGAGLALTGAALPELRRAGMAIARAVESVIDVVHPAEPGLAGVYGTIFTGPGSEGADLRNVTVFADAEVDRSPCGTGTCAVMAVLAAMEFLEEGQIFTHESLIGTRFRGRIAGRTSFGDLPAIVPLLEGEAYLTGRHEFVLDPADPLRDGFRLERA
jgi:proline racemase